MRGTLLYLSRNSAVRKWVETSPLARQLSARFVAGSTLDQAIAVCLKLRSEGILATLDYLGENVQSLEEATSCRDMYIRALHSMQAAGVEPNVSLKLTQFGIDFSESSCEDNVTMLAREAADVRGFVRVDMESSAYTDRTLQIARGASLHTHNVGVVLQAYLLRSEADLAAVTEQGLRVRLCKGAYLEAAPVAFSAKRDVDLNYMKLAGYLLAAGNYPAIATHDAAIVAAVERFAANHQIRRDAFEFQMLYGIRRDLQKRLVEDGYRVRLYVPFGEAWYPYLMRRLAERPANLFFLARNLLRR